MRRILANAANDRWRRAVRRPERPLDPRHAGLVVADQADTVADRDLPNRALARLPPRQRTVLVLRYDNDLSEMEIAGVLGCSVGTVKSQASRGLARLREVAVPDTEPTGGQMEEVAVTADLEGRLRAAMESAVARVQPPRNLIELVRRRRRRHVMRVSAAGAASVAVVALLIPAGIRVLGHPGPGPVGGQWPTASTVYAEFRSQAHRHGHPDQRGHQPAWQADPRPRLAGGNAGRQDPYVSPAP